APRPLPVNPPRSCDGVSRRRRRACLPPNRSGGLRRLPEDRFGLAVVCSLIAHAMMALLIFRAADLSGSGGLASSSLTAWMDLTAPEPERGSGQASTPATRTMRRSGPSARPSSPSRSASTAPAADSPVAENGPLGSLRAGSAPEPLVLGQHRSVLAGAALPQPPKSLVPVPVIDELAQDRQAPTAAASLASKPSTQPARDAEPVEMRPDPVTASVAEPH